MRYDGGKFGQDSFHQGLSCGSGERFLTGKSPCMLDTMLEMKVHTGYYHKLPEVT